MECVDILQTCAVKDKRNCFYEVHRELVWRYFYDAWPLDNLVIFSEIWLILLVIGNYGNVLKFLTLKNQ